MTTFPNPCRGFRLPAEVIEHAVWLYHCFSLSLCDVETILAAFGRLFANTLKRRRPKPGDNPRREKLISRQPSAAPQLST